MCKRTATRNPLVYCQGKLTVLSTCSKLTKNLRSVHVTCCIVCFSSIGCNL